MKLMLNGKEVSGMGHYVMAGDIKDATAEDSNVLSGKTYYNNNGKREGTMPNRGGMSAELPAGGSVSILEGYHNGEGVVRAQDLASQTQATAGAGDIASGKTAYVNGNKLTGSLVIPDVNDWDPEEMEEEKVLDLSGYSYVDGLTADNTNIAAGTYIFLPVSTITKGINVKGGSIYATAPVKISFGETTTVYAIKSSDSYSNSQDFWVYWKKN